MLGSGRDGRHRLLEGRGVGPGGGTQSADPADVLESGGAHVRVGDVLGVGLTEGLDASAHTTTLLQPCLPGQRAARLAWCLTRSTAPPGAPRGAPGQEGGQVAESGSPERADGGTGADLTGVDFAAADRLPCAFPDRDGQPGLAYGILARGRLVHSGGLGERWLGGPAPDAGTVFRIASMTKSFTATAVLMLRDEGALALDDLAEQYVPELRGWPPVTPDAQRVTIRHLLTMTAGFPTDDPWGDREQGTPLPVFSEFLAQGVS